VDLLHYFEVRYVEGVLTSFELHKRFKRLFVFYHVPRLGVYRLKLCFLVFERRIFITVDLFTLSYQLFNPAFLDFFFKISIEVVFHNTYGLSWLDTSISSDYILRFYA